VDSKNHKPKYGTDPAAASRLRHSPRFSVIRKGAYAGLVYFIVIVGLPIITIPSLRNRLSERILVLRKVITGDIKPAFNQVGDNPESISKEPEIPASSATPVHPPAGTGKKGQDTRAPGTPKAPRGAIESGTQ
jgi:hypothetical protein